MTGDLFVEHLTWPEVGEAITRGFTTVIVPCGAVEQHGPHLPLFVDAEHGTALGEAVARRLGNTLVAPTVRVGCSDHHLDFPGTISLRRSTFHAVCEDYSVSLARHGFRKICFLPSHGGNFQPLAEGVGVWNQAVGPSCRVVAFTDLMALLEAWRTAVEDTVGLGHRVGGHADIAEASLMLHLHPRLVRAERVEPGYLPEITEGAIVKIIREGFKTVTPNGILGDPRGMSAAIGKRCMDVVADMVADYFCD